MKFRDISYGDETFEIHVTDAGTFFATKPGKTENLFDRTYEKLDDLTEKLAKRSKARRVKINIPFTYLENGRLRPAVVTGQHKATDKWLIRVDGETLQLGSYEISDYRCFLPMNEADIAEYDRLNTLVREAVKARDEYTKKFRFDNLRGIVEKTWKEAGGGL